MDDCEPVRFGNFDKGQQIQLAIEAQGWRAARIGEN